VSRLSGFPTTTLAVTYYPEFNDPAWIRCALVFELCETNPQFTGRAIVIILFVLDTTHSAVYIFSLPAFQLLEPFGRGIYAAWDLWYVYFSNGIRQFCNITCSVTNFNNPNILGSEPLFWCACQWAIGLIYTSGGLDDAFHNHCYGHLWRSYSSISHP
jgi:hypothetical protein